MKSMTVDESQIFPSLTARRDLFTALLGMATRTILNSRATKYLFASSCDMSISFVGHRKSLVGRETYHILNSTIVWWYCEIFYEVKSQNDEQ